jgi:dTDP-4-dehydrorhamnose reductase
MRIAVIGGNGQLGADVVRTFEENDIETCALTHADIDLVDHECVWRTLRTVRPQFVVNTAAMHDVEACEREPEKAFAVNATGARNLALAAQDINATLLHVSTDYVFNGNKREAYQETDCAAPLNVYGNSKLAGECFVRATLAKHIVLRTSGLYGESPCRAKRGGNFVELMLKLAKERGRVRVVDTEWVTPTSTREVARQMVVLVRSGAYGLFHATAEGSCSWYEFARAIFQMSGTTVDLMVASPDEFPAKVSRPAYSVLENRALKTAGLNAFATWQEGLREYLCTRSRSREMSAA